MQTSAQVCALVCAKVFLFSSVRLCHSTNEMPGLDKPGILLLIIRKLSCLRFYFAVYTSISARCVDVVFPSVIVTRK
jgi:hypothetical protein